MTDFAQQKPAFNVDTNRGCPECTKSYWQTFRCHAWCGRNVCINHSVRCGTCEARFCPACAKPEKENLVLLTCCTKRTIDKHDHGGDETRVCVGDCATQCSDCKLWVPTSDCFATGQYEVLYDDVDYFDTDGEEICHRCMIERLNLLKRLQRQNETT